jgi:hypothetical protein
MVSGYDLLTIGCEHFWSWSHGDEARRAIAIASSYPRTQDLINVREPESTRDSRSSGPEALAAVLRALTEIAAVSSATEAASISTHK